MNDWEQFKTTSTNNLLDYIQDAKKDETSQENALVALIFRFREDLVTKVGVICKNRNYGIDVAIKIVEESFLKYAKTKSFKKAKCNVKNIDTCFKLYLYRIAKNVMNDYYKIELKKQKGQLYTGKEEIITCLPSNIKESSLSSKNKAIHQVLKMLPHEELVVYLTYKRHEKDGVNLPLKLRTTLREYIKNLKPNKKITQATIRSYKKRATDKVNQAIQLIESIKSI